MSQTVDLDTAPHDLGAVLRTAATAAAPPGDPSPAQRGHMLTAVADALDAASPELVKLAGAETRPPERRLTGELSRTTWQLRLFAGVLADGSCLDAVIDIADPDLPPGPGPDASCPVLRKAHPGHQRLSIRSAEVVTDLLTAAPEGTFAVNGRLVVAEQP